MHYTRPCQKQGRGNVGGWGDGRAGAGSKCTARAGIGRMQQVEDHMNSAAFAAIGGQGLMGLAKELRNRCEELKRRQGERLPK